MMPKEPVPQSLPPTTHHDSRRILQELELLPVWRHVPLDPWHSLDSTISGCRQCSLIKPQPVPGIGTPHALWLFIAYTPQPGATHSPFAGQTNILFHNLLAALQIAPETMQFLTTLLKCQAAAQSVETMTQALALCRNHLEHQIAHIQPGIIIALGKETAQQLLNTTATMETLRGKIHHYRNTPLVVTHHPAYLLEHPEYKKQTWQDLCRARKEMR